MLLLQLQRPQKVLPQLVGAQFKRFKFSKPDIHVCLLQDVEGMGRAVHNVQQACLLTSVLGEIVMSELSRARNYLVPFSLAYYVPRFKGKPILPDGWQPPVKITRGILPTITPAILEVNIDTTNDIVDPFNPSSKDLTFDADGRILRGGVVLQANLPASGPVGVDRLAFTQLLKAIEDAGGEDVPCLKLSRTAISPVDSTKIFGSVAASDIQTALKDQLKIVIGQGSITLMGASMGKYKDLGIHTIQIKLGDSLPVVSMKIELKASF